jgi:hypothetical protein
VRLYARTFTSGDTNAMIFSYAKDILTGSSNRVDISVPLYVEGTQLTNVTLAGQSNLLRTSFANISVTNVTQAGQSNLLRTSFADISLANSRTETLSFRAVSGAGLDNAGGVGAPGGWRPTTTGATIYYTGPGCNGYTTNIITFYLVSTNAQAQTYDLQGTYYTAGFQATPLVTSTSATYSGPGYNTTNIVSISFTNINANGFSNEVTSFRLVGPTSYNATNSVWILGGKSVMLR